jgi:hypothetical protein
MVSGVSSISERVGARRAMPNRSMEGGEHGNRQVGVPALEVLVRALGDSLGGGGADRLTQMGKQNGGTLSSFRATTR